MALSTKSRNATKRGLTNVVSRLILVVKSTREGVRDVDEKKNCPRTENSTRTISKSWSVANGSKEIAAITMSVTTTPDFQVENIGKLLQAIAEDSHSVYLEVGNALKAEP